jgi:hypothetical protein
MVTRLALLLLVAARLPLLAAQRDDVVFRAMRDELARSTTLLKAGDLGPPYFVAYREEDTGGFHFLARFGSLVQKDLDVSPRRRSAAIELRVGSHALDQTNFKMANPFLGHAFPVALPLDDNYLELRRALWLGTDAAFRQALEVFAKKKAALGDSKRPDATGDFSPAAPASQWEEGTPLAKDADTERLARDLSAVFRGFPGIRDSSVTLDGEDRVIRYVNSEGTSSLSRKTQVKLVVTARAQAADGAVLQGALNHYARTVDGLPSRDQLLAEARRLGTELTAQREAQPFKETYNGPVLFEGRAAGMVLTQLLAHHLVASKKPVLENGPVPPAPENPFQDRIGARVLPAFLSVADEPGRMDFQGSPLFGGSRLDDEGVPTRSVQLIDHGKLKTLLTTRVPCPGFEASTGSRHGSGPAPTHLWVTAENGLSLEALKERLLQEAKARGLAYGMIVRSNQTVKLFPDGHEEPVRTFARNMTDSTLKDILAAGQDSFLVHANFRAPSADPFQDNALVSLVAPSLLFEEVTFKPSTAALPKPPVAKHPYFDQ